MRKIKKVIGIIMALFIVLNLSGCALFDDWFNTTKGELVGQDFTISTYDHYANKTLTIYGSSVNVGLLENSANFDSESTGYKSDVIEITINGKQAFQVGNTVLFAEAGLDLVTDFEVTKEINAQDNDLRIIPIDRFVNDWKNKIGSKKTVIVSSQMGIPIGVYQGDKVYVTVPSDLPKMTRLNIDGKSLYIHRANYVILDTDLIP